MVGKVLTGRSISAALSYILNSKKNEMEHRAELFFSNGCNYDGNIKELIQQFQDTIGDKKDIKNAIHLIYSLPPPEKLNGQQRMQMAYMIMDEFKLEEHQVIGVEHIDKAHAHFHFIINKISSNGKKMDLSFSKRRVCDLSRQMEEKFGLKKLEQPMRFRKQNKFKKTRNHQKEAFILDIKSCMQNARTLEDFSSKMKDRGYDVMVQRGIVFQKDSVKFKGSELGYSLATIQRQLGVKKSKQFISPKQKRKQMTTKLLQNSARNIEPKPMDLLNTNILNAIANDLSGPVINTGKVSYEDDELEKWKRKKNRIKM